MTFLYVLVRLSSWCSDKESACKCRRYRRLRFDPWVGTTSWSRKWQPTPGFLPGKFHRQRSLVGYSPWGRKESDVTEWLNNTQTYDRRSSGQAESPATRGPVPPASRISFQVKPISEISKQVSRMQCISDLRRPAYSRKQLERVQGGEYRGQSSTSADPECTAHLAKRNLRAELSVLQG